MGFPDRRAWLDSVPRTDLDHTESGRAFASSRCALVVRPVEEAAWSTAACPGLTNERRRVSHWLSERCESCVA